MPQKRVLEGQERERETDTHRQTEQKQIKK